MESNVTLIRNLIKENKTCKHVNEILRQNFPEVTRGFLERNVRLFCPKLFTSYSFSRLIPYLAQNNRTFLSEKPLVTSGKFCLRISLTFLYVLFSLMRFLIRVTLLSIYSLTSLHLHLYFNVLPQTICNAQRNAIS